MNGLLVGVDAGGTSTRALAFDPQTGEGRTARRDGANWTVHGPDLCRERLGGAVAEAAGGRPIHSLALCIAGYYPPDHQEAAQAWARATWPDVPHLSIQTDVHAAWAGAFGGEPGIVVISGTGSIAYGRNAAGEEARAGGWGPLFGDQGSAYALGIETLRHMSYSVDAGDEDVDEFFAAAMERWPQLGSDLRSWLRGVYREKWGREDVAALGGFTAECADGGSGTARALVSLAATELVEQAGTVNERLGIGIGRRKAAVALQGGLGERSEGLREAFSRSTAALSGDRYALELVSALYTPLQGALILAALQSHLSLDVIAEALRE